MAIFSSVLADYDLQRYPRERNKTAAALQAWDASDALLLEHLQTQGLLEQEKNILLVNDSFGALAVNVLTNNLPKYSVSSWSDSLLSHLGMDANLQANHIDRSVEKLTSLQLPTGKFDLVLIKLPKTLALLEDQLIKLLPCITANTVVIAAGMVKYIEASHYQLFERYLGATRSSLSRRKARLIFVQPAAEQLALESVSNPYPDIYQADDLQPGLQLILHNHANVFCRQKLDIGARFFIEQFGQLPAAQHLLDLGCGNGVLGICAKYAIDRHYGLDSHCHFVDESYMAVDSARVNVAAAFGNEARASFTVSHCLEQVDFKQGQDETNRPDVVLCNPPFHQGNSLGDQIASQMLQQSFRVLRPGGELWVIGNRHLSYHHKIKRVFGNCETVAGNKKFVVLCGKKTSIT